MYGSFPLVPLEWISVYFNILQTSNEVLFLLSPSPSVSLYVYFVLTSTLTIDNFGPLLCAPSNMMIRDEDLYNF